MFINDLPESIQDATVDIFADDTTLSQSSHYTNVNAIQANLQLSACNLSSWSNENLMVLNCAKTKTMLITGKRLKKTINSNLRSLEISVNGNQVEQVTSQKLLGVILDDELSFDNHIDELCSKLAQRIGLLKKLSIYVPVKERIAYYNATVKSLMMYGSNVWSNTSKENLERISKLQKRAARVILSVSTRARSKPLFKELGWIPFTEEVKIRKAVVCYNRVNENCPQYINNLLRTNSESHNRTTRYSNFLIKPPAIKRKKEGGRSFSVVAAQIWNALPIGLRKAPTLKAFKTNFLNFLRS